MGSDIGEIEGVATTKTGGGCDWVVIIRDVNDIEDIEVSAMLSDGIS